MSASANVLKSLHAEVGGTEGVEEVVDRLKDEMENVDEVGRVLNEANTSKVDEEDVDEEFAAMEKVEREKREKEEADKTASRLAELEGLDKQKDVEQSKKEEEPQREMQAETV
jgi:charged multivesicular body protein 7